MEKKRPYLSGKTTDEAIKIWKEKHKLNVDIPESSILEDIIQEWIKKEKESGKHGI